MVRVIGLEVDPDIARPSPSSRVASCRELRDLITVKVGPARIGHPLDQVVAVEAIHHEITPESWHTLQLLPALRLRNANLLDPRRFRPGPTARLA